MHRSNKHARPTAALILLLAFFVVRSDAGADEERIEQAKRALAQAPKPGDHTENGLHIVLLADVKDHGPDGNGQHDYPLWQKRWALLLGGRQASSAKQVNLVGSAIDDAKLIRGAPSVEVTTAWQWPTDEQFKQADVIVAFCYMKWTDDRLAQMRRYLEGGGGLVLIHAATWTKPSPSPQVAKVVGIGGFQSWRHGRVKLTVRDAEHPICIGLPKSFTFDDDEAYWPPVPMMDKVTVLATSQEKIRGQSKPTPQPIFWIYAVGEGRVFGCVPGHATKTFDDPLFRTLLLRGVAWSAGESPYRLDSLVLRGVVASQ